MKYTSTRDEAEGGQRRNEKTIKTIGIIRKKRLERGKAQFGCR
jgi:hypothetical protein